MATRSRFLAIGVAAAAALATAVAGALPASQAQVPVVSSTSSTSPASTTTSSTTSTTIGGGGSTPAPPGAQEGGDGGSAPGRIQVPPEAQRIINSVRRTPANSSTRLLAAVAPLEAVGLTHDEAIRVGFGRFPVAGDAHFVHDWLYPRYGPGFRFHLGCDVMAAYGTAVRAPVDGVATSSNDSLGGLTARVTMPDRTQFAMAHLSALADGFTEGMDVKTGDIVGYVGDSGNARGGAPHVHFSIRPRGGSPVDPKPVLDRFLAEAEARAPELIAYYRDLQLREQQSVFLPPPPPILERAPVLTADERVPMLPLPTELLFATSANPAEGGVHVAAAEVDALAAAIDWPARAHKERAAALAAEPFLLAVQQLLGPLAG
jgi:murein DD-endopeptidase MepM/ murein hydrolase activator NlpD